MITKINREEIESTNSLAEAIKKLFRIDLEGRLCIFTKEAMNGDIASYYDKIGRTIRQQTYQSIAEDFKLRVDYREKEAGHNTILDIGCGSGLLSLELTKKNNGIIYGLDISKDMIKLANKNKEKRREEIIQKIIKDYEKVGYDFSRSIPAAYDIMPEIVDVAKYNTNKAIFINGSVYNLTKLAENKQIADYILCRNSFHRFREPENALKEMYSVLKSNGKIYIRDLKRDADWKIVVERIGEYRWKCSKLVTDYIGAMAAMLTTNELETILNKLGISNYEISGGDYRNGNITRSKNKINEYERETEYVCVIKK